MISPGDKGDITGLYDQWVISPRVLVHHGSVLVHHGLFSPASGEKSQGRVGSSIWSRVISVVGKDLSAR